MPHARSWVSLTVRPFTLTALVLGFVLSTGSPLSTSVVAATGSTTAQGWQSYKSAAGRFSVLMPCAPTTETKATETDLGPINMQMASCVTSNRFTSVIYYDVPATVSKSSDKLLTDTADAFMKGGGFVEKASRQQISINGHPGIEIIGESGDGQSVVQARYYLVRSRVYLVMIGTAAADVAAADIGEYFGSFLVN